MYVMRIFVLLAVAPFFASGLSAQESPQASVVSGVVTEAGTPLAGATVWIPAHGVWTLTDSTGQFELIAFGLARGTLLAEMRGFFSDSVNIELDSPRQRVDFELQRDSRLPTSLRPFPVAGYDGALHVGVTREPCSRRVLGVSLQIATNTDRFSVGTVLIAHRRIVGDTLEVRVLGLGEGSLFSMSTATYASAEIPLALPQASGEHFVRVDVGGRHAVFRLSLAEPTLLPIRDDGVLTAPRTPQWHLPPQACSGL